MGDGSNSINYHRVGVIRENLCDVSIRQMIKGDLYRLFLCV